MQLDDAHEDFRQAVRKMAGQYVTPIADALDTTNEFPMDLIGVFADMGLTQLALPEAYGGPGGDLLSACIAREEVARAGSMTLAQLAGQNGIVIQALLDSGSDELKNEFLPALADGRTVTCIAITESDVGSDPATMKTRAVRDGGDWLISGQKQFITWGSMAKYAVVFARTNDQPRSRGISAFLVDCDQPGWVVARHNDKMGQHGVPNNEIYLESLRVPDSRRIGAEGGGFRAAMHALHLNRPTVAGIAVGGAQCALDYGIGYAKERETGGHLVSDYQGIRWLIAEDATHLEAARGLVYSCATAYDNGAPESEVTKLSSMAKYFAAETLQRVTYNALQLAGGHGYMKDHPLERYARDGRLLSIYEGTTQIQKNIIAKSVLA